ncbi:MAG: glucose-6-phosphate dehydrogenase [Pseudomonadota bacterium]
MSVAQANSAQLIPVQAFDLIVFGAVGDLSLRKLMPSLFRRWRDGQIPPECKIVGVSRGDGSDTDFRLQVLAKFREFYPSEPVMDDEWARFAQQLFYRQVNVTDPTSGWAELRDCLEGGEERQRVFYLALPPSLYGTVSENIASTGLKTPGTRIVLEKPIGKDLESAREINAAVGAVFAEEAIFRIDHYLGKETVQNLLVLRLMNSLFEPVWNANFIDHIEITVAESIGAGGRAGYYDTAGALRDMVQNHLIQLMCLVAMEPPLDLAPDTVRDEKIKVLRALRPITVENVRSSTVRGQYGKGVDAEGVAASYQEELGRDSTTETFVALKANIDNWRWRGMPIFLRTGKRMSERRSEIIIQFKDVAHSVLGEEKRNLQPTRMVIRLQPDEGVKLLLVTKDPGPGGMRLRYVPLNLSYAETFEARYPDAYERLLMAVVRGDLALFMRRDEVESAWEWVDGVLRAWAEDGTPAYPYAAGTDGPAQSEMMLDRENRSWFDGA